MPDTRDIIADIDALLRGDISGPEQVRGVLKEAREELLYWHPHCGPDTPLQDQHPAGPSRVVAKIDAMLPALDGGEAVPVAWRYRWVERTGDDELPGSWRYTLTEVKFESGRDGSWREVEPLFAHPPRSEVEGAVAEKRAREVAKRMFFGLEPIDDHDESDTYLVSFETAVKHIAAAIGGNEK